MWRECLSARGSLTLYSKSMESPAHRIHGTPAAHAELGDNHWRQSAHPKEAQYIWVAQGGHQVCLLRGQEGGRCWNRHDLQMWQAPMLGQAPFGYSNCAKCTKSPCQLSPRTQRKRPPSQLQLASLRFLRMGLEIESAKSVVAAILVMSAEAPSSSLAATWVSFLAAASGKAYVTHVCSHPGK